MWSQEIIGVAAEKDVSLEVYSYENSPERTIVPAYDFGPIFVNRNSQVAVCVT